MSTDEWHDDYPNPMYGGEKTASERTGPVDGMTDAEKLAWCKERAAAEDWTHAMASVISDMGKLGIPLNPDLHFLFMGEAMIRGERGVREFIDGITLASVARPEASRG